jgi:uncharacterized membrane protein YhaH (DUF805 family)
MIDALNALKKYGDFSGRARRREYWMFSLFYYLFLGILLFLDSVLGLVDNEAVIGVFSGIYTLALFIPGLAVQVRRLHDTGRSGWWILIGVIPVLGLVLLGYMWRPGDDGSNRWGDDPKAPVHSVNNFTKSIL